MIWWWRGARRRRRDGGKLAAAQVGGTPRLRLNPTVIGAGARGSLRVRHVGSRHAEETVREFSRPTASGAATTKIIHLILLRKKQRPVYILLPDISYLE